MGTSFYAYIYNLTQRSASIHTYRDAKFNREIFAANGWKLTDILFSCGLDGEITIRHCPKYLVVQSQRDPLIVKVLNRRTGRTVEVNISPCFRDLELW
jgi:hypothetical protein